MNKINCNIIKDILPLYIDDVLCQDTRELIENHIAHCHNCKQELALLKSDLPTSQVAITPKDDVTLLKKIGLAIRKQRLFTGVYSAIFAFIIAILLFAYLTTPQYIPYSEASNLITIQENGQHISLSFSKKYNYELIQRKNGVYDISLYKTLWNQRFGSIQPQSITVNPNTEKITTIYYVSNGEQLDTVIYGKNPNINGGSLTLPRLFLNFYFRVAILLIFVLIILLTLFRKTHRITYIIVRILFIPTAYITSHLLITGFNATSYAASRDFYLILLLCIPIYYMLTFLYIKLKT
jgi:hypothetical protein